MLENKNKFEDETCLFLELDRGVINPNCKNCLEKWCLFLDNQKGLGRKIKVIK